jgi:hypothetical protein
MRGIVAVDTPGYPIGPTRLKYPTADPEDKRRSVSGEALK